MIVADGVVVAFEVSEAEVDLIMEDDGVVALVLEALDEDELWLGQTPTIKSCLRASAYDPAPTLLLSEAVASYTITPPKAS